MDPATSMLVSWIKDQKLRGPAMKNAPTFYRNLEEALDVRRADHGLFTRTMSAWKLGQAIDFCSNDLLSLGASGMIRQAFLEELARHPDFNLYAGGSRLMDGNYSYIEQVEQEIADFHGSETALLVSSGYEANGAIVSAIPRPGDAIIYDELVHASLHDGLVHSLALCKVPFRHNDIDAFEEALQSVLDTQPLIKAGSRTILVAVESVYSMDGDTCPLLELMQAAKHVCGSKVSVEFIVDEAHATGVVGPMGRGLVNALGLEKEVAVRLHTCGKALASTGAVILGSATVRMALMNFARSVIYTTAPSFPTVAAVRAGYNLLRAGATLEAQTHISELVRYFFKTMALSEVWEEASAMGILSIPLLDEHSTRDFVTHIVPVWTRDRYNYWLVFHLQLSGICAFPIGYPTVPKGQGRIRIMFHGRNTEAEVDALVAALCGFAKEMLQIEKGGDSVQKVPRAAQRVYALMAGS
ncbi:putative secondary metabolism biosynthetic enzyme [Claviceps citrina]|nr:putative secondary metabolism biosynthetic enzyme [Claviceps citrina]